MKLDDLITTLTQCRIYDLEHERHIGMPEFKRLAAPFSYFLYRQHENEYRPKTEGPRTGSTGVFVMSDHSGTHIDALCHQASDLTLFGGVKVSPDVETPWGFKQLGSEAINPIITRGVLIDVATHKANPLPDEYEINLDDFKQCMKSEGIAIRNGDAVLVRTGFGMFWNQPEKFMKAAGVGMEVSLWLQEQNIGLIGADNQTWDAPGKGAPAHLHLLAKHGTHIVENLNLEELAKEHVYEFLFIGLPLKFKGATGSPMRPVAVVPK